MAKKKENRGGARKGTGPKPKPEGEKKIPLTLSYKKDTIKKNGGGQKFKDKIYKQFPDK